MGKLIREKLEMAKEVDLIMREGLSYQAALRQVKEMYSNKKKVAPVPASFRNNDTKTTDYIIADGEDIDNNEIYDRESGQTIRDLI